MHPAIFSLYSFEENMFILSLFLHYLAFLLILLDIS